MVDFPIDFVIPYVTNFDTVWRETYNEYCIKNHMKSMVPEMDKERYRDYGYLSFVFRSIAENMPFIRKVFLIVSNIEQVPFWANQEIVQVVLHKDFIPQEYLPTFNSTTIEMFLPDIEGLSDCFIYGNDDIYILNPTKAEDYFTDDMRPKLSISHMNPAKPSQYWDVCKKVCNTVLGSLGKPVYQDGDGFDVPIHSLTPIYKPFAKEIRSLLWDSIRPNISAFRTNTNFNQYIYTLHPYYTEQCEESTREVKYFGMWIKNINRVIGPLNNDKKTQEFVVNDTENTDRLYWKSQKLKITQAFLKRFPNKSKYEK